MSTRLFTSSIVLREIMLLGPSFQKLGPKDTPFQLVIDQTERVNHHKKTNENRLWAIVFPIKLRPISII